MAFQSDEKTIIQSGSLILTEYRVIKSKNSLFSKGYTEIFVDHIDTVKQEYENRRWLLFLGIFTIFFPFLLSLLPEKILSLHATVLVMVCGLIIVIICVVFPRKSFVISSENGTIIKEAQGVSKEFAAKLDEILSQRLSRETGKKAPKSEEPSNSPPTNS